MRLAGVCLGLAISPRSDKTNILAFFGDEVVWFNASSCDGKMTVFRQRNLDRIAENEKLFIDTLP